MQLSVIIVNYNVRHFLEQCLYSLQVALNGIEAEVWVVDNASSDESVALLKPQFPRVNWVESAENLGFSRANNLVLGQANGEFVLFLNPDTLLPEDCLHQCLSFMEKENDAGALGIRMVDGGGRYLPESKRGYPGPLTSFFKLTGLSALFPASPLFARYYLGHLPPLQSHPVEVLAGAFMLVRKQVLDVTGGFDERYFMYGEDIDLSYQINKTPIRGSNRHWKTWYFAGSTIIHFKGESTHRNSLRYVHTFYQAMLLFVKKHYPPWRAIIFSLFIYLAMVIKGFAGLLFRRRDAAPAMGPAWVVGTQQDFEEVSKIFSWPGIEGEIAGRLAMGNEPAANCKTLDQWVAKHPKDAGGTLIFCPGPSVKLLEIVKFLRAEAGVRYFFHYSGSKSIVGSSHSNSTGDVITEA